MMSRSSADNHSRMETGASRAADKILQKVQDHSMLSFVDKCLNFRWTHCPLIPILHSVSNNLYLSEALNKHFSRGGEDLEQASLRKENHSLYA